MEISTNLIEIQIPIIFKKRARRKDGLMGR
jgi:hypothetical protein